MTTENQDSKDEIQPENHSEKPEIQAENQPQDAAEQGQGHTEEDHTEAENSEIVQDAAPEPQQDKTGEDFEKPHQADMDTEVAAKIPSEKVLSEIDREKASDVDHGQHQYSDRNADDLVGDLEKILNQENAGAEHKKFNEIKAAAQQKIDAQTEEEKKKHTDGGESEDTFSWIHPLTEKIAALANIFRGKHDEQQKKHDEEQAKNLAERQAIIEKLKNLYTNTEPGTNLFKAIRAIKEEWSMAGQIAKSEFKILNNNYFHHLNQFYQMLDLNKEYLAQEHSHNLEKRQQIIARAQELENEPSIQKTLNELQHLHRMWKEEAEPVAEEFREKTWEEFKAISDRIHARRIEFSAELEASQNASLERKNAIIAELNAMANPEKTAGHSYWQHSVKKVEQLREEFLKTGSVPRKLANQNWNDFKQALRNFNTAKNAFYKNLKGSQQENLEKKQQLLQTAKDNMNSEDWEAGMQLFKKLQEEWKTIGHVPRHAADQIWEEFRAACNTFFENYRRQNNVSQDNWKDNYKAKKGILDELKGITEDEDSAAKIDEIRKKWNAAGKVPKDKMDINREYDQLLREKLRLNNISAPEPRESRNHGNNTAPDRARKTKNQITDLENEIATLERNLGFFSNPSRENPLLADTYKKIDAKKSQLEQMKKELHDMISE